MKLIRTSRAVMAATGLAFAASVAMPAVAQEMEEPAAEAPDYSENKLQSFAVAFAEVDKVKQEYTPRMEQAGSEEEQQEVQSEAGQQMMQAVEDSEGISVDEYNEIIQSAQADPEFAQELNVLITEETGGEAPQGAE